MGLSFPSLLLGGLLPGSGEVGMGTVGGVVYLFRWEYSREL